MKILLIIPVYNEDANISMVYEDIKPVLKYCDYLFINDCSDDNTADVLNQMQLNHLDLPINLGLSSVIQIGYKYAYEEGYDAAIQFDGDGQHQAIYIEEMIGELEKGYDIIIASRFLEKKKDWSLRLIGSRIISLLFYIRTGKKINDPTSGLRLLNRKMLKEFAYNGNRKAEPDSVASVVKHGATFKEIQVEMNERVQGLSMFNPYQSVKYMFDTCISLIFYIY